jgi:deoxyribodipyrimidine photo-lyase
MRDGPVILWFRRDLRLRDHAALTAASESGRPVLPVFVHDETVEALGAAAKWRLGAGVKTFAGALRAAGSLLTLRRGDALAVLRALVEETGAAAVYWQRVYDPDGMARDREVKSALKAAGIEARSFAGAVVFEPWTVATGQSRPYSVYSPFWKAVRSRDPGAVLAASDRLRAPESWPVSEHLDDWRMGSALHRGAAVVARHAALGEAAAQERLDRLIAERLPHYRDGRHYPARDVTSGLSENLVWGEISPRVIWRAGMRALDEGVPGAEKFLSELVWRDFAWHLMYHHPKIATGNWRDGWDSFPWRGDNEHAERWRRGMTGEPFVDAAMREMYVTGRMHNRARMIVASYLTKHLLTDWRVGLVWFEDCLTDWNPASNAMGWQWVAGSGPDAPPYFRVFNPATQAARFDPDGACRARWIAEERQAPEETARDCFRAAPRCWGLSPDAGYPDAMIDLAEGRRRALDAHAARASSPPRTLPTG